MSNGPCTTCGSQSTVSGPNGVVGTVMITLRYSGERFGGITYQINGRSYVAGKLVNDGLVDVWDIDVQALKARYPGEFSDIVVPPTAPQPNSVIVEPAQPEG